MSKSFLTTLVFLLGTLGLSAQSSLVSSQVETSEKCELLLLALGSNNTFSEVVKTHCGGSIKLLNHGFDFQCAEGSRNVALIDKANMSSSDKVLSIFSLNIADNNLYVEYVLLGAEDESVQVQAINI